jgi:hypothetical protein
VLFSDVAWEGLIVGRGAGTLANYEITHNCYLGIHIR